MQHLVGSNRADIRFDGSTLKLVTIAGGGVPGSANGIAINTGGFVGIGTSSPITNPISGEVNNGIRVFCSPGIWIACHPAAITTAGQLNDLIRQLQALLSEMAAATPGLGSLMARHKVNIASMSLNRDTAGGHALTVLNLDSVPPAEALEEIRRDPDISDVQVVRL